ncbi:MAG: hypothetical protein HY983_00965 [Candidatus Magasanikbacteria bacterium]|nr:hypothetical protein [Candidatus Magasanikbacteria bacterium]
MELYGLLVFFHSPYHVGREAKKIAANGDSLQIRTFLKKIGSNFTVKDKKFDWLAKRGWKIMPDFGRFLTVQWGYEKLRTDFMGPE